MLQHPTYETVISAESTRDHQLLESLRNKAAVLPAGAFWRILIAPCALDASGFVAVFQPLIRGPWDSLQISSRHTQLAIATRTDTRAFNLGLLKAALYAALRGPELAQALLQGRIESFGADFISFDPFAGIPPPPPRITVQGDRTPRLDRHRQLSLEETMRAADRATYTRNPRLAVQEDTRYSRDGLLNPRLAPREEQRHRVRNQPQPSQALADLILGPRRGGPRESTPWGFLKNLK